VIILLTGSTGFVGTALLRRLMPDSQFEIRAAVRDRSAFLPDTVHRCEFAPLIRGDAAGALRGVDTIVHLAARVHIMNDVSIDPLADFRIVNVDSTLALARRAAEAGVKRFVFLSSAKVNGEMGVFSEIDEPAPQDAYSVSKLEAELGLGQIAADTGLEVVTIRPPLVYGPGVKANFLALIRAVQRGVPMPFAAVENRRSLVAVDNLTDFIVRCVSHSAAANQTFFVSDGEDLSTSEIVGRLASAMGRPARLFPMSPRVLIAAARLFGRANMARRLLESLQLDISKARRQLQWSPPLSVNEGIRRTVASL
jgi:nucleoside-diphosphate-sugar epimerase